MLQARPRSDSHYSHFLFAELDLNQLEVVNKHTNLQSQFRSSYYPFSGDCCSEKKKFRVNVCFETNKYSVQTADDNSKIISKEI